MKSKVLHTIIFLLFSTTILFPQKKGFRIVSYNVENLFDTNDDPNTDDDTFTEKGDHLWTNEKYRKKLINISKAIMAAGEWETPIIIGLCEVENKEVINDLIYKTPLQYAKYKFVHKDSPDKRGVDVALLYQPSEFQILSEKFLFVNIGSRPTRDILFVSGLVKSTGDTLHVFVNHWPSRYGGEIESEEKRKIAASVVRKSVDSLFAKNPKSNIVIMGDFNDYSYNESLTKVLGCQNEFENPQPATLYNLCYQYEGQELIGSHKYGGRWGMLDHLIVSGNLLCSTSSINTNLSKVGICNERFLLKKDLSDYAPKRAFLGDFFAGGFSDHLPVYVDFNINKNLELKNK